MNAGKAYLDSSIREFKKLKAMGDKSFAQLEGKDFYFIPEENANSIGLIIQHMSGNMVSRFTDFLTTDGEKPTRKRDAEFEPQPLSAAELLEHWENGWNVVLNTLNSLTEDDLLKTVLIRNETHTVIDAINRQIAHYAYHTGQIVYLAKYLKGAHWQTLSIAKGKSQEFNKGMFGK